MRRRIRFVVLLLLVGAAAAYFYTRRPPSHLVLSGIVTTDDVIVSSQVTGRLERLLVSEGDTVTPNQLIGVISPDELREERAFYSHSAEGAAWQVQEGEAALRLQEMQTSEQIAQAEASMASTQSQRAAAEAELENARITFNRSERMVKEGIGTVADMDKARTTLEVAKSRIAALDKQIDAERAAVSLAKANAGQIAVRRNQLIAQRQQQAAAVAQRAKADVRLAYTEVHAPIGGIVDVRAARAGEVVTAGQPIVTLINPDELWVRADVEETYIDRVRAGDKITVRLPSGEERQGTVFYRGADAGFATQRDVSRTKRDIRTFEIRLRVDNSDRRLAVGMTAYVLLPVS